MPRYDVLLKGGTVLDPAAALNARRDVAIADGRVAALAPDLPADAAAHVYNVSSLIVTPGLIDYHLHAFWGGTYIGLDADRYCLPRGVTTVVDGGSAGAYNFLAFRRLAVEPARTRVLCFLNLSSIGQVNNRVGELEDLRHVDAEATARCVQENRDVILGLKVRLSRSAVGANGLQPLKMARELADRLAVPIMVHISETDAPLPDILALLRRGDVVTHALTARAHGILDEHGQVLPAVKEAVARGIILDSAMGRMHLSYAVARAALAAGVLPDAISTDATIFGAQGIVHDLPSVMSRFMALGLSLEQVLARTTANPARLLGRQAEIGTLATGACADVAAFAIEEGEFAYPDNFDEVITARQRLVPRLVLRAGAEIPVEDW